MISKRSILGAALIVIVVSAAFVFPRPTINLGSREAPEESFLIVIDPPKMFDEIVKSLGFLIVETANLADLGLIVVRVRIPNGKSLEGAKQIIIGKFPMLEVDTSGQFGRSSYVTLRRTR